MMKLRLKTPKVEADYEHSGDGVGLLVALILVGLLAFNVGAYTSQKRVEECLRRFSANVELLDHCIKH